MRRKSKKTSKNTYGFCVECYICKKKYSKIANMKNHFQIKHLGKRYVCEICKEEQISKFSYLRHIKRWHKIRKTKDQAKKATENEVYISDRIEMSDSAKDALIKRLRKEIVQQTKLIQSQKSTILSLRQELNDVRRTSALTSPETENSPSYQEFEAAESPQSEPERNWESLSVNEWKKFLVVKGKEEAQLLSPEISVLLSAFITEIRNSRGKKYSPDTIFFICLCIQKHFNNCQRMVNIFMGENFVEFRNAFDAIAREFRSINVNSGNCFKTYCKISR